MELTPPEDLSSSWWEMKKQTKKNNCVARDTATIKYIKLIFLTMCTSVKILGFRFSTHTSIFQVLVAGGQTESPWPSELGMAQEGPPETRFPHLLMSLTTLIKPGRWLEDTAAVFPWGKQISLEQEFKRGTG